MSKKYHTLQEEYQERFYRLPKVFFTNEKYQKLSNHAKLSYAILQDRLQLSIKNNWVDEETGHIYFIYSNEKLQEILNCGRNYPTKIKNELVEAGLLEVKKRGKNTTDKLFLLKPEVTKDDIYQIDNTENDIEIKEGTESRKSGVTNHGKRESGVPKIGSHESRFSGGNDTELKETDLKETEYSNNNKENASGSCGETMDSIYELYKTGINPTLPVYIKNKLKENREQYGKALVEYAIEQAIYNGKAYNYAVGVLKKLEAQNIKTVEEAEQARNKKKSTTWSNNSKNLQSKEMTPQWLLNSEHETSNSSDNDDMTEEERHKLEKDKAEFLNRLKKYENSY